GPSSNMYIGSFFGSSRTSPAPSSQNESSPRAFRSSDFVTPSSFVIRASPRICNARGEEQPHVYAASSFLSVRVLQLCVQPGLGKSPIAPHCHSRNLKHFCHFVVVETAKIFQLDDLSFS